MDFDKAQLLINLAGQAIPIASGAVASIMQLIATARAQAEQDGVVFDDAALDKVIAEAEAAAARRRSEADPPLAESTD